MKVPERIRLWLESWAVKTMRSREPDFIIRPNGRDQMLRWWILPKNRFFNVYLHKFILSDEDRALHDHPWWNASVLIIGDYIEHTPFNSFYRSQGYVYLRRPSAMHRVELCDDHSFTGKFNIHAEQNDQGHRCVTTLFITGPKVRDWGFACPKGWVPWQEFCDARDKGVIGKGCD